MAAAKGAEVCFAAPGAWTPRRIAFHPTSTFSSAPAMEPLNEPVTRAGGGGSGMSDRGQQQQQQMSSKLGKSDPLSLPSSMPLHWTAPLKIGAGLSNLGNTCFLNSVLQCLTYTPPLAGYLLSGQHKASCRVAGFCAFCALQEHVQQALTSSGKVVSPQKLAKNLRCISRSFRMGRQEDSHEYMRYLLEALHKCCLPPDLAKNSNSKSSQEKSLVYRIFGGQLRSQVKCTVCSHCSNTYDPFLDLSLEIVRADSLVKALSRFTAVDVLDGDNKYRCIRCKKKVRALKNFTIDTVPNILTIQFKRFSSTGGHGGKIDKKVDFGTTLDLKPFVSNGQENVPKYKLFGVLVHSGWSTHSGHYYCFLRASTDIWHVFDDTRVRQVSERTVLEQKAYMLFYVREGKRPSTSHSEVIAKLASSQPLNAFSKERERNLVAVGTPWNALPQPVVAMPKEKESIFVPEVAMDKVSSERVGVTSEDKESDSGSDCTPKAIVSQPACVVSAKPTQVEDTPAPKSSNGVSVLTSTTATNGSGHDVVPGVIPFESSRGPDDSAVGVSVPELSVPVKEVEDKDVEMENCSTSGNLGGEDDWDEYYKKGWNATGSTPPPNFLKMLRVIPHTRRYYQARAAPARRASKVPNMANGESEIENSETSETLGSSVKKDAKRQYSSSDEMRGSNKRQQREYVENGVASADLTSELLTGKVDEMETTSSDECGPVEKESRLRERVESTCEGSSVLSECHANKVGELRIVPSPLAGANGLTENNGHVDASHDHLKECAEKRELQCSGAERRVDSTTERNGQHLGSVECGGNIHTKTLSSEKETETMNGTALSMEGNDLYGSGVPRWGEVDADENSAKEIDRLLEQERESSAKLDSWDLEYDRGRSKKVRNKTGQETLEMEISSNGTLNGTVNGIVNGTVKPSNGVGNCMPKAGNGNTRQGNPFQSFGMAKQHSNGVKAGNSFGFKSGYGFKSGHGYGTKVGKNVGSAGLQTPKRID